MTTIDQDVEPCERCKGTGLQLTNTGAGTQRQTQCTACNGSKSIRKPTHTEKIVAAEGKLQLLRAQLTAAEAELERLQALCVGCGGNGKVTIRGASYPCTLCKTVPAKSNDCTVCDGVGTVQASAGVQMPCPRCSTGT